MAGLLLGLQPLPAGLGLPIRKLGASCEHHQLRGSACAVAAAACSDGLAGAAVAELSGGAGNTSMSVGTTPPRVANHTRRLVVPAYALAGTRTRRRRGGRSGLGGGGDDDELGGGGGDDGSFWGGDGGGGGDGFWGGGSDDEGGEGGSLSARLQDLLLLWSLFCGLAFAQAVHYVSPKPKVPVPPAFAALSYSGLKASLLARRGHPSPAAVLAC